MSPGTILVSLAVALGVGAYVAWPFRRAGDAVANGADVEGLVEAWVRRAQAAQVAVVEEGSGEIQAWSLGPRNLDVPKSVLQCRLQLWR